MNPTEITVNLRSHKFYAIPKFHETHKSTLSLQRFTRRVIANVISISLICNPFAPPSFASDKSLFDEVWKIVDENYVDPSFNGIDWREIKEDYSKKISSGADELELTKKMLSKLGDKYSRILDKQYFESLWKYDAIGIGLIFQSTPGAPMVVSAPPISGSSSEKAGLHKNDVIYAINGKSTDTMTAMDVLDMMSNDDSDTVKIVYSHSSSSPTPSTQDAVSSTDPRTEITLKRSKQKAVNPVSSFTQSLSDGTLVGYIRLKEFNNEAAAETSKAIARLEREGVQEYVLDLRGNTGGGFQFALNIGGLFLHDKPMVTAQGKQQDSMVFRSSYPSGVVTEKPLVLWVDGLSASASEVLASGLRDNCRAVLAGTRTFGKGKIQAVFGLSNGGGLTLTVAQYITPKGSIIQSKGIEPDLPISSISPYVKYFVDPLLSKPDVSVIDFTKAKSILDTCPPVVNSLVTNPGSKLL